MLEGLIQSRFEQGTKSSVQDVTYGQGEVTILNANMKRDAAAMFLEETTSERGARLHRMVDRAMPFFEQVLVEKGKGTYVITTDSLGNVIKH